MTKNDNTLPVENISADGNEEEKLLPKFCLKCGVKFTPEHENLWTCPVCRKANTKLFSSAFGIGR
jgi:ribosomal protein S27AE